MMSIESLLLPDCHPARPILQKLCASGEDVLSDYRTMKQAGFQLREEGAPPRACWQPTTFLHPDLPGYSVTAYPMARSSPTWDRIQRERFADAIERDQKIRECIEQRRWSHLTIARSWLYPVDERLARFVLISEELPKLSYRPNLDALYQMDEETLFELLNCIAEIEVPFEGSLMVNFLAHGQMALNIRSRLQRGVGSFASHLLPYLRPELRKIARREWTDALRRLEERWPICHPSADLLERMAPLRLPEDHPVAKPLVQLLLDRAQFADFGSLVESGFCLVERGEKSYGGQLLVVGHPELPGYVIKSYPMLGDRFSPYRRLQEYCSRCERSRRMARYIEKSGCRYLTVPKKWIYHLGGPFISQRAPNGYYLLIVEKMELLPLEEEKRWYLEQGELWIEELLKAYIELGGLDCHRENLPVTRDGKMAMVDTEHVGWGRADQFPSCFERMVGLEGECRAKAIWERLREQG